MRVRGLCAFCAVVALVAVVAGLGCDRWETWTRSSSEPPPRPRHGGAPSAARSARPAPDGGAPRSLPLEPKVRRGLLLSPLKVHDPGIAIGKGRVGVLTEDALVVRDTTKFAEVARIALRGPRYLAVLADGSFLAPDAVRTWWLLPHDTKARSFPRLVLFPESTVFADRRAVDRFWVLSRGGTALFSYGLAPSSLGLELARDWVELDGFDGRAFGSLRDGSFLYSTTSGFRRFFGPGKTGDVAGDPRDVFRLLPGSRPDTLWLLKRGSAELFLLLAGKLVRLKELRFDAMAYDVEADGRYLAVLELLQPTEEPWRFVLEVFDVDGKRRLREFLSADESLDPDRWLAVMTRNRRISLWAADPPLVAVGGPESLSVWRADRGDLVWRSP